MLVVAHLNGSSATHKPSPDGTGLTGGLGPATRPDLNEPPGEDGWLTARFSVESVDVARMFVVGLGPQAVVIDPPELRDSVVEFAHELIKLYQPTVEVGDKRTSHG